MPRKIFYVKISECYRRPIAFPTGLPWHYNKSPLELKIEAIRKNGPKSMPPIDICFCVYDKPNHEHYCPSRKFKYYVIDGCHRCMAFEKLGYTHVRASL